MFSVFGKSLFLVQLSHNLDDLVQNGLQLLLFLRVFTAINHLFEEERVFRQPLDGLDQVALDI